MATQLTGDMIAGALSGVAGPAVLGAAGGLAGLVAMGPSNRRAARNAINSYRRGPGA